MTAWPPARLEERMGHTPRRRIDETPGQYVRRMRQALGRSVEDVRDDAGLSRSLLFGIESGSRTITLGAAIRLGEALGFDPRELFEAA